MCGGTIVTAAPAAPSALRSGTVSFVTEVHELLNTVHVGGLLNSFLPSITIIAGPRHFRVYVKIPDADLILRSSREMKGVFLGGR